MIELRNVEGGLQPVVRTVSGGNSRINTEVSKWSIRMSDEKAIRAERKVYR